MCEKCFQRPVTSPLRRALGQAMKAAREFDEVVLAPGGPSYGARLDAAREARAAALDRLLGEILPLLGVHVPPPAEWGDDDRVTLGLPADMAG